MSKANVIISLDGHTQAFVDFKPWLARKWHEAFDEALAVGIETFRGGNKYFADLAASGHDFQFENAEDLMAVDWREYNQAMSCDERLARIDQDGVAAEMLIDGFGAITSDPCLSHAIAGAFNRWFADYTASARHRFTGAVVVSLHAGVDVVVREIADAFERGVCAIHLPPAPRVARVDLPDWNDRLYEPIWRALDERGMAMIWHASVGREKPLWRWQGKQPGWETLLFLDIEELHCSALRYLLLAGVPERFPGLKFGYVESGSTWIPPILKRLDTYMSAASRNGSYRLTMLPSEQWARQGFAAGPLNRAEVGEREGVGIANLCFGSDYIHTESTYPHTRRHLASLFTDVPRPERDAILRDNAVRLFGFDLDKLAMTPAAQRPLPIAEDAELVA